MHSVAVPALAVMLLALTTTPGSAEGDAGAGEKLAREHCTKCHDIEPEGAFKEFPPSFASIATFRSRKQIYARIAFPTLHTNMPPLGYVLFGENLDHLTAYIVSLEKR